MKKTLRIGVAVAAASAIALTTCGNGGGNAADGEISYWLWDANQLPAYQQCADDFAAANEASASRSPSPAGTTTGAR